jgi:hypothetical protein
VSLRPLNIADFDQRLTIQQPTNDDTAGSRVTTYSNLYVDVPAKEVKAIGSREKEEEGQVVAIDKRAFVIRKFDRVVLTTYRCVIDSENYNITSVHRYGQDRSAIVLECEARDND